MAAPIVSFNDRQRYAIRVKSGAGNRAGWYVAGPRLMVGTIHKQPPSDRYHLIKPQGLWHTARLFQHEQHAQRLCAALSRVYSDLEVCLVEHPAFHNEMQQRPITSTCQDLSLIFTPTPSFSLYDTLLELGKRLAVDLSAGPGWYLDNSNNTALVMPAFKTLPNGTPVHALHIWHGTRLELIRTFSWITSAPVRLNLRDEELT